jgi:hypothetical protein
VIYGFTVTFLSAELPIFLYDLIKAIATGASSTVNQLLVGFSEVTVQILLFSWLFFKWEKRRNRKLD